MVKKKDQYGSIGLPGRTSVEERTKIGAYQLRGRTPFYNFVYRAAFITLVIVIILILVGGVNGITRLNKLTDTNASQLRDGFNPAFKVRYDSLGAQIVEQWYTGGEPVAGVADFISWPTPVDRDKPEAVANLPVVEDISFLSGERFDMLFDRNNSLTGHNETLRYLIRYNNVLYTTTITLQISDTDTTTLPSLVSTPSLTPYKIVNPPAETDNAPVGMDPATDRVKAGIQSQVDLWARAWTADDRAQLKQITQDADTDRSYQGLGGWEVPKDSKTEIRWAYTTKVGGESYLVAQVKFSIKSFGPAPTTPEEVQKSWTNPQMMDILIKDYETGLPSIVSWGSAGSWSTLEEYSTAITTSKGEPVAPEPTPLPTEVKPTTTGEPTPAPEPSTPPTEGE